MSYFRILTICLLLVYFVSAAGCHCFDLQCFVHLALSGLVLGFNAYDNPTVMKNFLTSVRIIRFLMTLSMRYRNKTFF